MIEFPGSNQVLRGGLVSAQASLTYEQPVAGVPQLQPPVDYAGAAGPTPYTLPPSPVTLTPKAPSEARSGAAGQPHPPLLERAQQAVPNLGNPRRRGTGQTHASGIPARKHVPPDVEALLVEGLGFQNPKP